jgi:hypothetical protein
MHRNFKDFETSRPDHTAFNWLPVWRLQADGRGLPDDRSDLDSIARSEGWHEPPVEVTRVVLRPWQQAVFWALRLYIVAMLAVIVVGFVQFAARP